MPRIKHFAPNFSNFSGEGPLRGQGRSAPSPRPHPGSATGSSSCAGETGGAPLTIGLSFDTPPVHHLAIQERREEDNNYCMLEWRFVFYYL